MAANPPIVVIDNGSATLRAGYPSEPSPRVVMPSVVGAPRNKGVAMAAGMTEYEVGAAAVAKRGYLNVSAPVRAGVIQDWSDMERLWSHVMFQQLRISPESYCFVIGESMMNTDKHKEKTLETLMESFNAHSMYLGSTAVLSLYAYGLTTGVVVDSGLELTTVVPVHEGYPLARHMTTSTVAGEALTSHLSNLLQAKGYGFSTQSERELVNGVKENLCFIQTPTTASTAAQTTPTGFTLPDGQYIPLEEHRTACPEALFNFSVLGESYVPRCKVFADAGHDFVPSFSKGISWLTYAAINNCEASLRPALYSNIVLAGGTTLFPGVRDRLHGEVVQLFKEMHVGEGVLDIQVKTMDCRQYSAWLGGCMLSMIAMFKHLTVSRAEYEEYGPTIVHRKRL